MSDTEEMTGPERYRHAVDVIHAAATRQGLCSEADSVLADIGLPRRRPAGTYRVTFAVEGTATYEGVSAQNAQGVRDLIAADRGHAYASAAVRDAARRDDGALSAELAEVERTDGDDDDEPWPLPDGLDETSSDDDWDAWFAETGDALRKTLDERGYRGHRWVNEALDDAGFGGFPVETMHDVVLQVTVQVPADGGGDAREEIESLGSRPLADRVYSALYGNNDAYEVVGVTDTGEPHYRS